MQFAAQPHFELATTRHLLFTLLKVIKSHSLPPPSLHYGQNQMDDGWPKARRFNYSNEILNKLIGKASWASAVV